MNQNQGNLYHYTNSESLFKILENQTLKLGTFDKVNDPKESKNWNFKFFCLKYESRQIFNSTLFNQINSFILDNSRILCMTKDNNIPNPEKIDHLEKGYSYARMWAQYADRHTGACLVFDKNELESTFNNEFSKEIKFNGNVEYLNSIYGPNIHEHSFEGDPHGIIFEQLQSEGFENYILKHIKKFYKFLYFFKHFNWRDENEYRFVVLKKSKKDLFIPIKNSLKQILITDDFPKEELNKLIKQCKTLNIKIELLMFRGWAIHATPLHEDNQETFSFNGISYPTDFDYKMLYTQVCDSNGKMRTFLINFNEEGGEMIFID